MLSQRHCFVTLLPVGSVSVSLAVLACAGAALLAYTAGKLTRDQFEDAVAKARDLTATNAKKNGAEPSGCVRLPRSSDLAGMWPPAGNG